MRQIEVNVAYRWYLGLTFDDLVPHHSTISKVYFRKFENIDIFEKIFLKILDIASEYGYIGNEDVFADATHTKANANKNKFHKENKVTVTSIKTSLLDDINELRLELGKKAIELEDYIFSDNELEDFEENNKPDDNGPGMDSTYYDGPRKVIKMKIPKMYTTNVKGWKLLCERRIMIFMKNKLKILFILLIVCGCNNSNKYRLYQGHLINNSDSLYTDFITYNSPYSSKQVSISKENNKNLKNKDVQMLREDFNKDTKKYISCIESKDKVVSCLYNDRTYYSDDDYYVPEIKVKDNKIIITHKNGEYTDIPFIMLKGNYKEIDFKGGKISYLESNKLNDIEIKFTKSSYSFKTIDELYK